MPEFPIPSARILLVSQIQGGQLPPCPPVRYAYANFLSLHRCLDATAKIKTSSSNVPHGTGEKSKYTAGFKPD